MATPFRAYSCVYCLVEVDVGIRAKAKKCTSHDTFTCATHDVQFVCPGQPTWNVFPEIHPARLFQILAPLVMTFSKKLMVNHATTDVTKKAFVMAKGTLTEEEWVEQEVVRRQNTNIDMQIGNLHESMLASAPGCVRLKEGARGMYGMDIFIPAKGILIEVKNKFNTTNSNSLATIKRHFEHVLQDGKTGYYITIIPDPKARKISLPEGVEHYNGSEAYDLLFGRPGVINQVTEVGSYILSINKSVKRMAEELLGIHIHRINVGRAPRRIPPAHLLPSLV